MLLEYLIFGVMPFLLTVHCKETEVLVEAGSQAILPCKSSPSHPNPPLIIWRKGSNGTVWRRDRSGLQYWGAPWSPKRTQRFRCPHSQFERGDYSLQIDNVNVEDAGIYSCWVTHGNSNTEEVIKLRVITVSISSAVPIWGQKLTISCNVFPRLESAMVQWTLNGSLRSGFRTQTSSYRNATLSVVREKVTLSSAGNWTCTIRYKDKQGQASANVTVKGIIQPFKDNTKVYAAVGSAVTLPCVFSPGLIPLGTRWEKVTSESLFGPIAGDLPASFSLPSSSQAPMDKSATLKQVGLEDEGRYRCSGTVEGRGVARYMQLVVAKINSSTPSKKGDSVTLTCELTADDEVTEYEWVHVTYDVNGTQEEESIFKGKTVNIDGASEENRGEWVCRFYGKDGMLGNVTHHLYLMSGLTGKESQGPSNNTGALVGLSFLLAFLLLVLIKMYKNHQRRKRILQYPALETIVHTNSNEREARGRSAETK